MFVWVHKIRHMWSTLLYVMALFPTAAVSTARHFPSNNLELGAPNLLVTAPGMCDMYKIQKVPLH